MIFHELINPEMPCNAEGHSTMDLTEIFRSGCMNNGEMGLPSYFISYLTCMNEVSSVHKTAVPPTCRQAKLTKQAGYIFFAGVLQKVLVCRLLKIRGVSLKILNKAKGVKPRRCLVKDLDARTG